MTICNFCKEKVEHEWVKIKGKYYHHDCFDKNLGKLLGIKESDLKIIQKVVNYV